MNYKSFQHLEYFEIKIFYLTIQLPIHFGRKDDLIGYCEFWCFWFLNLRLKHPNKNLKNLVSEAEAIIRQKSKFRTFIRNYTKHVNLIVDKNSKKFNTKEKLFNKLKKEFSTYK